MDRAMDADDSTVCARRRVGRRPLILLRPRRLFARSLDESNSKSNGWRTATEDRCTDREAVRVQVHGSKTMLKSRMEVVG